jgi:small subunit ribosomal protein S6
MNRTYEVMYIVRPDLEEADLEKLIEGFNTVVTNGGGEVTNIERLGRRRLAYIVRKFQDGIYVLLHISADGPLVAELERRLRVTEQVIKFITVRTDEENKRLAKVKALRDSKVKVSAQQAPAAPVAAAPVEAPAAPAVEAPAAPAVEAPAAPVAEAEPATAAV